VPTLTVAEMLMYTAELKRPENEPHQSKTEVVEQLLVKLGLDSCRDVLIGNEMIKGVSGGQKKRANIGIALVANPRVLYMDEPTTGLDSFTANEVRAGGGREAGPLCASLGCQPPGGGGGPS
jgi:ABC-type multidrug transport system ATPase subunit